MGPQRVDLVDLYWRNPVTLEGLRAAKSVGVKGIYHKATEGATVRDPEYPNRRRVAGSLDLPFGPYHFASPDSVTAQDAAAEARAFLAWAEPRPGDLPPMLDFEGPVPERMTPLQRTAWVRVWRDTVRAATGVNPILYTNLDLVDDLGLDLWVARYNDDNRPPRIPVPFRSWVIWQFTDGQDGTPDKVPGLGRVDANTINAGTAAAAAKVIAGLRIPPAENNVTRARAKILVGSLAFRDAATFLEATPKNRTVARTGAATARAIAGTATTLLRILPKS